MHKAALKGDWEAAEILLVDDPTLAKSRITEGGETACHIAALEGHAYFVANLLEWLGDQSAQILEIKNQKGNTALTFAAVAGHVDIADLMVQKNQKLPTIRGEGSVTPLYMAAFSCHRDMVDYLFELSGFEMWDVNDQIELLTTSIANGLYDLATRILQQNNMLAWVQDRDHETPLRVLARDPSHFCGTSDTMQLGLSWRTIARALAPVLPRNMRLPIQLFPPADDDESCDAYALFAYLWELTASRHQQNDIETGQANAIEAFGNANANLLFTAAESANDEFLVELIRRYPDFLYKVNESKHSIFHIAVLHRHVQCFNLIYEVHGVRDLILSYIDTDGNNILHLAGRLAPQNQLNQIPGAALQMQREVMWFKEVEKLVKPSDRIRKNDQGQTPYDVLHSEHRGLRKDGEKMMKQTAKACMLVSMLIATVVFTTAFTVPGGYNNTGSPSLQNNRFFNVFPTSEAVATLSSLTSVLMFLSILISRYAEDDFLDSLPFWMVIGVAALLVSIAAMIVAFCTCLIFYQHGLASTALILFFFAIVPVMFVALKYPLLVTILRCTYDCRSLFRSNNRLLS
ncbi:ankyrin repeat domain-containing protein 29-like [Dorcoceras hygrometricum]|uniref:Ankyrin repeat domain-containing protein 29-like n=1 Tax=Dorcoceras hygrometricum TaxID=472368 RepID=A0A2Z7A0L3_9LAMI|nr:ankyrin repeat domain-containing protein 29-like [Dorcoceras hygrometricum]